MKIAKLNNPTNIDNLFEGGEGQVHKDQRIHYIVEDTYDFVGNDATDVTSIENWDKFSSKTTAKVVYDELKAAYDAAAWNTFTANEQGVFCKRLIASKVERDVICTDAEQVQHAKDLINKSSADKNGHGLIEAAELLASQSSADSMIDNLLDEQAERLYVQKLMTEDYNLKGYQKERTFNALGDLDKVTYYEDYVDTNNKGKKRVEEDRTYTRNGTTGILEERDIVHKWFEDDVEVATKNTKKKYSAEEGYEANKRAAKNLTRQGSMYLVSQVGVANGQAFLDTVVTETSAYEAGSRSSLLAAIAAFDFTVYDGVNGATVDATKDATIKATMDVILNVAYAS